MNTYYCLRVAGLGVLSALAAIQTTSGIAFARDYPTKPIRLVVPFTPGGGTDMMARLIAREMSKVLGQSVVVDNRGGGGGTIGAEMGVRASPDGYTLLMIASSYASNAVLYKLPYDPVKDLKPIVLLGETGFLIALNASLPAKSTKELINLATGKPGELNYASPGTGSSPHLAFELLKRMAGIEAIHVPYKGSGPAIFDLLGGQIQMMITGAVALMPHVRSGKLRGIAVTSAKRMALLPDIASVAETVPGYEAAGWYGFCSPKGVSDEIVILWGREVNKILQSNEMKKRLEIDVLEPVGGEPERLLEVIKSDIEKWRRVVRESKIMVN